MTQCAHTVHVCLRLWPIYVRRRLVYSLNRFCSAYEMADWNILGSKVQGVHRKVLEYDVQYELRITK